jgi:hypothetical protein
VKCIDECARSSDSAANGGASTAIVPVQTTREVNAVALDQVVDHLEALIAQQSPPRLHSREHLLAVALAPTRADQVRTLQEANVGIEERLDLLATASVRLRHDPDVGLG